ncbi:MAG: SpoIIIAC/SpoIIIAD family protein [Lachnospiraceae bacterium]
MEIMKIVGFAVSICCVGLVLKQSKQEYMVLLGIAGGMLVCGYIIFDLMELVDSVRRIWTTLVSEEVFLNILLQMIGITYLCELTSSVCKEVGYATLATQIVIAGKVGILLVGFPVLENLLEFIVSLS